MSTKEVLDAIAYERAPRRPGSRVNIPIRCADGFTVSVQASDMHYANDGDGTTSPYFGIDRAPEYPFVTFEVGYPSAPPPKTWRKYDSGGVWAFVPRRAVHLLLAAHGGVSA